jgi:hypothetical protein
MVDELSPEQRQALRARLDAVPWDERLALRRKLLAMTPEQRAAWLAEPK